MHIQKGKYGNHIKGKKYISICTDCFQEQVTETLHSTKTGLNDREMYSFTIKEMGNRVQS